MFGSTLANIEILDLLVNATGKLPPACRRWRPQHECHTAHRFIRTGQKQTMVLKGFSTLLTGAGKSLVTHHDTSQLATGRRYASSAAPRVGLKLLSSHIPAVLFFLFLRGLPFLKSSSMDRYACSVSQTSWVHGREHSKKGTILSA